MNIINDNQHSRINSIIILTGLGIVTVILWQFSIGRLILYPFTILGTWFHEMGHGITALILGSDFVRLELYSDGSGTAVHTSSNYLGALGRGLIAAGGPIGPTIAGSVFLISSGNNRISRLILFILGIFLILSDILWVRTIFGFIIVLLFGITFILIALKGNDKSQRISMQFLGLQAFLSLYLSVGYLYSTGGSIGGNTFSSDTQVMEETLLLPHWIWASLILLISIISIIWSILFVYKKQKSR